MIYKTNNCNFAIIESDNFLQNNTQDNTRRDFVPPVERSRGRTRGLRPLDHRESPLDPHSLAKGLRPRSPLGSAKPARANSGAPPPRPKGEREARSDTRPDGAVDPLVILVRTDYSLEEINRIDQDDELPQNSPILIRQNAKYPDRV
jgi:hypothetical protein